MNHPFQRIKRRPFEPIAEWSIRLVASFSILVIFLIFLFVFRETLSLFTNDSSDAPSVSLIEESKGAPEELSPERYQDDDDLSRPAARFRGEAAAPEIPDRFVILDPEGPEIYNPMPEELAALRKPAPPERKIYVPKNPDYPEIYNPEVGGLPDDIDVVTVADATAVEAKKPEAPSLWGNLAGSVWQPIGEQPKFGVIPLLIGTTKTTIIAILLGAPLGILAALYTAFFAPRRVREVVKPAIELLAGFPSVVVGFFCLVTVASFIQNTFDTEFRLNALVGGIGLSLAVLPIVYSIAEDALSAVPKSLREASLALGSSEWQTAYRVMLPAAAPGVIAAVILGIGRAFGETMIAIMATGNAPMASWSWLPTEPARTMAATIGSEMGEVVWGSEHYGVLFLLGALLLPGQFRPKCGHRDSGSRIDCMRRFTGTSDGTCRFDSRHGPIGEAIPTGVLRDRSPQQRGNGRGPRGDPRHDRRIHHVKWRSRA